MFPTLASLALCLRTACGLILILTSTASAARTLELPLAIPYAIVRNALAERTGRRYQPHNVHPRRQRAHIERPAPGLAAIGYGSYLLAAAQGIEHAHADRAAGQYGGGQRGAHCPLQGLAAGVHGQALGIGAAQADKLYRRKGRCAIGVDLAQPVVARAKKGLLVGLVVSSRSPPAPARLRSGCG